MSTTSHGNQQQASTTPDKASRKQNTKTKKKKEETTTTTLEANSLAEWARTVDLQPLLDRRQAIHREKNQGKPAPPSRLSRDGTQPDRAGRTSQRAREPPTLDDITKAFLREPPSLPLNNIQVKELYDAAKRADQDGDRTLAKSILWQLKETTPNDARIYRRLARMEKEEGNVSTARAILQEGLRLHPNNAFLWHGLAQVAASDLDRKTFWRRAMAVDPTLPHPYHALGTLEHSQGRIAVAMKILKQGIEYCPTNHRMHHALGDLYRDAKMLDMAERSYRKALQHGPAVSAGFAYTALAYVSYEQGELDRCRSWLQKSVKLNDGRHANGWVALAQLEESEGNIDAARAVCVAGIAQYERGLLERSARARSQGRVNLSKKNDSSIPPLEADPVVLKDKLMKRVPVYRSGDRFFNVYRNWARLEERYGTLESADEVYKRAAIAFPHEWKLSLDKALYYVKLSLFDRARTAFADACRRAGSQHADPYRAFAEFEMSHGDYKAARRILYRGATAMSQTAEGGMGSSCGLAELFHTWAVCEWHLNEIGRAEVLFDHALRMTNAGDEGSKLRSFILYSMARLEHFRDENLLAQHCIGLCLKENFMPGGNSKIWELWADVAAAMNNDQLAEECLRHAEKARSHENKNGPYSLLRLLESSSPEASMSGLSRMKGQDMVQLMRRDPWHHKIFGSDQQPSSFFHGIKLPEKR